MEGLFEIIFQNDGIIFKVAQYIILTGSFLLIIGLGLCILLGIFSMFTDERDEGDKSSFEDIQKVGIEWQMMGYGLALMSIPVVVCLAVGILLIILMKLLMVTKLNCLKI